MKRILYIVMFIAILVTVAIVLVKPMSIMLAKRQLSKVFVESEIKIGDASISPLHKIELLHIHIKRSPVYDFKVPELAIRYNLVSLFQKNILKVSVKDAFITIDLPKEKILEFKRFLSLGPPGTFKINEIELSDIDLDVNAEDIMFDAQLSAAIDPRDQKIRFIDLALDSVKSGKTFLTKGALKVNEEGKVGELVINNIQHDKVKVDAIKSTVRLKDNILFFDSILGKMFNGKIEGSGSFGINPEFPYLLEFEIFNLDLERIVNDFELKEKFRMSGLMGGKGAIQGKGTQLEVLDGKFFMMAAGGILVINDTRLLENIARGTKQPLDVLVESFRNYKYNTGNITVTLEKGDILCDMALEGDTGKRNLNITLHNFN